MCVSYEMLDIFMVLVDTPTRLKLSWCVPRSDGRGLIAINVALAKSPQILPRGIATRVARCGRVQPNCAGARRGTHDARWHAGAYMSRFRAFRISIKDVFARTAPPLPPPPPAPRFLYRLSIYSEPCGHCGKNGG